MILSFDHPLFQTLAWVLLHFLWQGALLGLLARAGLWLLRRRSPQVRYLAACGLLLLLALAPVATFAVLRPQGPAPKVSYESASVRPAGIGMPSTLGLAPDGVSLRETLRPALPWAVALWMGGVALLSLRLLGGWLWLLRLQGRLSEPAGACWQMGLDALARRMRVRERVRMLRSWAVDAPMVVGWIKPVILVPAAAFTGLSPEALEAILAHELAHVRRHDYLVNLLQSAIEVLLFYHPAVWWVSAQIRQERELCCDDAAVTLCGDAVLYARALAALEQLRRPLEPEPQLALAAHGGNLMHRIKRLIAPTLPPSPTRRAGLLAAFAVTALGAGAALRMSEEPPKPPAPPKVSPTEKRTVVIATDTGAQSKKVKIKGEVKVQPDPHHDLVLGEGGSLELTQKVGGETRTFKAWKEGANEKRHYSVNDKEQPVDAAWLAKELAEVKSTMEKGQQANAKAGEAEEKARHIEVRVHKAEQEAHKAEQRMVHIEKKLGDAEMHRIQIDRNVKDGEKKVIRIEKGAKGPDGKTKVYVFRDGEGKREIDVEKITEHARQMAEKHKDMAIHLKDLRELHLPDFDFDFDDDDLPGGKKVIIQRHAPGTAVPGPKVWVEDGKRDPRREMDQLRAEIDRLHQRLERLQERLDDGHAPMAPKPPRPPKAPMTAPPPPPPPTPRATPAPKAPPAPPAAPTPAPK